MHREVKIKNKILENLPESHSGARTRRPQGGNGSKECPALGNTLSHFNVNYAEFEMYSGESLGREQSVVLARS